MGHIRTLERDDLPEVAALSTSLFPPKEGYSAEKQLQMFDRMCFENPWYDPELPSLVYEDAGRVVGFIAVIPRRMVLGDRPVRVAVGQHLMVKPGSRSSMAGLELVRRFLSGPQDLSLADMAADVSRKLWEWLGGTTSLLYSFYWRKPLRPFTLTLNYLRRRNGTRTLSWVLGPAGQIADSVFLGIARRAMLPPAPAVVGEEMSSVALLECLAEIPGEPLLRPIYDGTALQWLLTTLEADQHRGELRKVVVRERGGRVAGWYVYYLKAKGSCEVMQLWARDSARAEVFDHLIRHSWEHGGTEVMGRVEPRFMREIARRRCFVIPGRGWMLIHARLPEILQAIHRGDAFLSRLEGDLWVL